MSEGHVTAADFVRDRFGSRMLALAFALTGIVATMPYIALQLVGMEVVIGALGFPAGRLAGHVPLIIAFVILAAFTYTSGLRAPALIAVVKDMLIFITVFAAVVDHSGQARRLWRDLRQRAAGEAHARAALRRQSRLLQRLRHARARLGLGAVSLSACHDRHLELVERQRHPAQRRACWRPIPSFSG